MLCFYFFDDTYMKETVAEYKLSRPFVMSIFVDNIDQLLRQHTDSKFAQISSGIEGKIESWLKNENLIFKKTGNGNSAESMTKSMTVMMPIMTLWITFTLPATLGVYWTISNAVSILQTIVLNGYFKKKMEAEVLAQDIIIAEKKAEKDARYNKKKKKK